MASVPTITYCSDFIVSYTVAVDCGNLANPTNGRVDLTGTIVDSTATYSCDDRFRLQGQSTRTCQDDGQWSGSAPTCERKLGVANLCIHAVLISTLSSYMRTVICNN